MRQKKRYIYIYIYVGSKRNEGLKIKDREI